VHRRWLLALKLTKEVLELLLLLVLELEWAGEVQVLAQLALW
jgi:hypothetical protein